MKEPTNFAGVSVQLAAIDPNDNHVIIGDATTDLNGMFHYTWAPPNVPGTYTVYASFAGTNGYWPSNMEKRAWLFLNWSKVVIIRLFAL